MKINKKHLIFLADSVIILGCWCVIWSLCIENVLRERIDTKQGSPLKAGEWTSGELFQSLGISRIHENPKGSKEEIWTL